METKQVILIRRDLKCRRGKEISQGAHASMAFLSLKVRVANHQNMREWLVGLVKRLRYLFTGNVYNLLGLNESARAWLEGSFAKVVLIAENEAQLKEIYLQSQNAGLEVQLITDSGRTEFHGVPTDTAIGIGPANAEEIDRITSNLKLY